MRTAAAALAALLLAGPALAEDPQFWLSRAAEAARTVDYHGEVTHRHGDRVQALEIARRVGPAGYVERILTLSGDPREVVRDGDTITCVLPAGADRDSRLPRNPFPAGWEDPAALADHYELVSLGSDRVAGRACEVVAVRPRDGYRYGFRLWIDADTGLLLRSDAVDERGEVVEQASFTRVEIVEELDPAHVATTLEGTTVQWRVADAPAAAPEPSWTVTTLPPGFIARGVRAREHGALQQLFTDGLASVSVFVAPVVADRAGLSGPSRMGSVSAFGTVVDGRQVTVIGAVPPATVRLIGESLAFGRR